jgi:hypothetical protein
LASFDKTCWENIFILLVPQIAAPHFVPLGRRNKRNKGNVILLTLRSLLDYFCYFLSFCGTAKETNMKEAGRKKSRLRLVF